MVNTIIILALVGLIVYLLVSQMQTPQTKPHPRNYARPDQFDTRPCTYQWAHNPLQDVPLFKNFSSSVPAEVHLRG